MTHLPQLAAMADTHLGVEKGESGGRTLTSVTVLDRAQRAHELSRLTGGELFTDAMRKGAEELLNAADAFKATL